MSRVSKDTRASTSPLEPGTTSIDRVSATRLEDGRYRLKWTIVLFDGRRSHHTTFGSSVGVARRRARATAVELLRTHGESATWKPGSDLAAYIKQVSVPAMEKAPLAETTRKTYAPALRLIQGECTKHKHTKSLAGHTIMSAMRYRPMQDMLAEIARLHGFETARHARTVLTKYVVQELVRDELLPSNPLADVNLDALTGVSRPARIRGGRAVGVEQYQQVVDHLLALDPAEGVVRRQGRWSLETLVARRRNAIEQMLLQLATGLRSSEANKIRWHLVTVDPNGVTTIFVTDGIAKGGKPRVVVVLNDKVAQHLLARAATARPTDYVIGAPSDPSKRWDHRAYDKAAATLYQSLASELDIDIMLNERSHVWRTTLRTMYAGKVAPGVLDSQFGHNEDVARRHYTDVQDLSGLVAAYTEDNLQSDQSSHAM